MAVKPSNSPDWCSNGIKRDPTESMKNFGWKTSDGTVNGVPDKPTLEHTNGWMHNVAEFIKFLTPLTSDPIGTISMSMLTEQQMNQDNAGLWVLCDGRNCGGTGYAQLTGNNKVPDLRKKYLVGAGTNIDGTYFADLLEDKQEYLYPDDSSVNITIGGANLNIGGDVLPIPYVETVALTDIHTQSSTEITTTGVFKNYYDSAPLIEISSGGVDAGVTAASDNSTRFISPLQADSWDKLDSYNWPITAEYHEHGTGTGFAFPPKDFNGDSIAQGDDFGLQQSDIDISIITDINYGDDTIMYSMKTNLFIRIN